ncbi:hypothetical protein GQ54DRAFT_336697 [Martensiomyces pterosporus]|nr:hypothetical protein GQ54DRAFT_336697 [Martensiomyces pterosporus]
MSAQQGVPSLSFIPANDISHYVQTFRNNVPGGGPRISGAVARNILMQSKLPVNELGRIWELSDVHKSGSLSLAEFMLAMFLAQCRINGKSVPPTLPPKIVAEIEAANSSAVTGTPAQVNMPMLHQQPVQLQQPMGMPTPGFQQQPQQLNVAMPTPTHYGTAQTNQAESIEPVEDFNSRYPDIAPSGGTQGALNSVKQSFTQDLLGTRIGESQHMWAISSSEKAQYEAIFRRWDPGHRGVLKGDQAREVFAQSGLPQHELAKIWSLADINNQGELNLDEFSVAMHLIFRRLAGDQIPSVLPQELVPRSSKDFMDSLVNMKEQLMFKDLRKKTPASVRSETPVRTATGSAYDGDDSNDDGDFGVYKSANRRRNHDGRHSVEPSSRSSESPSGTAPVGTAESIEQLRRTIQQRKKEIEKLKDDAQRQQTEKAEGRISSRWRIDELKREIEDIHRSTPVATTGSGSDGSDRARFTAKRAKLVRSINELAQTMPSLIANHERLSNELADTKRDVVRKRDAKANGPLGTGSGDDMEARAARLVAQRMAALTGQSIEELESSSADDRIKGEVEKIDSLRTEQVDRMDAVRSGLDRVKRTMQELKLAGVSADQDDDADRWDDGVGVKSEEVRELVERLKRIEKLTVRPSAATASATHPSAFSPVTQERSPAASAEKPSQPSIAERLAQANTKQERDQILKDIAEERFRERQRALGVPEPEPEAAAKKPEMVYKPSAVPESVNNNPWDAPASSPAHAVASNPFGNQPNDSSTQPSRGNSNPIFANSLEVDNFSDTSSEEWDHNSDDEDNDGDGDGDVAKGATESKVKKDGGVPSAITPFDNLDTTHAGLDTPASNVSFNTAFANPALSPVDTEPEKVDKSKDANNPFHGLIAAQAATTDPTASTASTNQKSTGSATAPATNAVAAEYERLRLRALYPYNTGEADELVIEPGDLVETRPIPAGRQSTTDHADEGWMYGELLTESQTDQDDGWEPSGKAGWFPKDYAETLGAPGSRGWNKTKALFGTAKYNYEPQHDDELRVAEGDRVRVVDGDKAESWWKVRKIGGEKEQGMLPAMYIDLDN